MHKNNLIVYAFVFYPYQLFNIRLKPNLIYYLKNINITEIIISNHSIIMHNR
jgi:hypothetical protein